MKWNPEEIVNILKEYVYSKNKLDEYRNRVSLINVDLPSFYLRENESQSFSSIVVRATAEKEIKRVYDKETSKWIINSLGETILGSLNMTNKTFGFHHYENIYFVLYEDDGDLNYLVDIANSINTTIKIINYILFQKNLDTKTIKVGIGIANDPSIEMINDLEDSFSTPLLEESKDCVQIAETYAADIIMFDNLPVCLDAWVFNALNTERQNLIRDNSQIYFSTKMPHQRIFTDLVDLDIKEKISNGTLVID